MFCLNPGDVIIQLTDDAGQLISHELDELRLALEPQVSGKVSRDQPINAVLFQWKDLPISDQVDAVKLVEDVVDGRNFLANRITLLSLVRSKE